MNCPVCDAPLRAIEKYGVEVDICPGCKGVWLDRGELEKIIALEASGGPTEDNLSRQHDEQRAREAQPRKYEDHRQSDNDHDDHDDNKHQRSQYNQHDRPQKKRGAWLSDILGSFGGED